jgi:hypothetical protein
LQGRGTHDFPQIKKRKKKKKKREEGSLAAGHCTGKLAIGTCENGRGKGRRKKEKNGLLEEGIIQLEGNKVFLVKHGQ